jgi:hypothetical protein
MKNHNKTTKKNIQNIQQQNSYTFSLKETADKKSFVGFPLNHLLGPTTSR